MGKEEELRGICSDREFYSFGTLKIFEKRARNTSRLLKAITFLGLFSPVLLGGVVMSFSYKNDIMIRFLIPFLGAVSVSQAILSLFSLSFKCEEKLAYSRSAITNNSRLLNAFSKIKKSSNIVQEEDYIHRLDNDYSDQAANDTQQGIDRKEFRYAMRQTLYHFGMKCAKCGESPLTIKPSKTESCDNCANF